MEYLYRQAKTAGCLCQDVVQEHLMQFIAGVELGLGRKVTCEEEDEIVEGFWNGLV